jgi:hypothetical protein
LQGRVQKTVEDKASFGQVGVVKDVSAGRFGFL